MKLGNKLRAGVLATTLVGALGISGCGGTQTGRGGSEALLGLSLISLGHSKKNPGAVAVGRAMVNYGSAQAGRSNVNVNVNNFYGGRSNLKDGQIYICTAKDKWVRAKAVNGVLRATWDNSLINPSYDCKIIIN